MLKKTLALVLVGLLVNLVGASSAYAGAKEESQARFVETVKKNVAKLGTGADARVALKLRDNTKLTGYISEASEDSFVVVDAKTGAATTVTYPQVQQVHGNNLSTGAKIAIGVAIVVAIGFLLGRFAAQ
ncbi:MAG: hypothetical protein ACJ74W_01665 [Pyrinomonadaceae bacterium]